MPTYVYQAVDPSQACDACRGGFEQFQKMSDEALAACPACQTSIKRVIQPSYFNTQHSSKAPSDKKLEQLGFTKIVKDDDGKYKKQFGNDPHSDVLPSL